MFKPISHIFIMISLCHITSLKLITSNFVASILSPLILNSTIIDKQYYSNSINSQIRYLLRILHKYYLCRMTDFSQC